METLYLSEPNGSNITSPERVICAHVEMSKNVCEKELFCLGVQFHALILYKSRRFV